MAQADINSVSDIVEKWRENAPAGDKWRREALDATDDFRESLSDLQGISNVGIVDDFESGVEEVSASDFNDTVTGSDVANKFQNNFVAGVEGRPEDMMD